MKNRPRPVFLNPLQIRLPIAGIMSIVHRISGVLMVLAIPVLIWSLEHSLSGPDDFVHMRSLLQTPIGQLGLSLTLWILIHHLLSGIRFLLIDIDLGVNKPAYRITAFLVLIGSPTMAYLLMTEMLGIVL